MTTCLLLGRRKRAQVSKIQRKKEALAMRKSRSLLVGRTLVPKPISKESMIRKAVLAQASNLRNQSRILFKRIRSSLWARLRKVCTRSTLCLSYSSTLSKIALKPGPV